MSLIVFERAKMEQIATQTQMLLNSQMSDAQTRKSAAQLELAAAQQQLAMGQLQLAAGQQALAAALRMPPL